MHCILDASRLDDLLQALRGKGYRLHGPRLRDGAIVLDDIDGARDLPVGWTDEQEAGTYRLRRRQDQAYFGYVVGPRSLKSVFMPPSRRMWSASRDSAGGFTIDTDALPTEPLALIGARGCDLAAIAVQDRTLRDGPYADPYYAARRENLFIVAVNCTEPGGTCFCTSMNTGPRCTADRHTFDVALTEHIDANAHWFLAEAGTDAGRQLLDGLKLPAADAQQQQWATDALHAAADTMGRTMDTANLPAMLKRRFESPQWDEVASRCLSCTNCTLVCPTCFCTSVEDSTDLAGETAERHRRWSSCFTLEHSLMHGNAVRASIKGRYRQWLTHKLSTWHDQFDTSGCVGCGRCISWCPVGIDITAEVAAMRALDRQGDGAAKPEDA